MQAILNDPDLTHNNMAKSSHVKRPDSDALPKTTTLFMLYISCLFGVNCLIQIKILFSPFPWGPYRACHPGGNHWDYYPGNLSWSQITATHLKIRHHYTFLKRVAEITNQILDCMIGYQDSSPSHVCLVACPVRSSLCQLMPWLLMSPGNQLAEWHWPPKLTLFLSSLWVNLNTLHCFSVKEWWYKIQIHPCSSKTIQHVKN